MSVHDGSPRPSPCSARELKNRAREAAYMFRDGYLSSKAYQRRQLRRERSRRSEARQMTLERCRANSCEPREAETTVEEEEALDEEADTWTLRMYEQQLKDEAESLPRYLDGEDPCVWCPLCEVGLLGCPDPGRFSCSSCGASFRKGEEESAVHLEVKIFLALEEHDLRCQSRPQFLLTPAELGEASLLLVCHCCCLTSDISGSRINL